MNPLEQSFSTETFIELYLNHKKAFLIVGLILLSLPIGYLILRPGINELAEIQNKIRRYEAVLARQERQAKNERAIQRSLEEQEKRYIDTRALFFTAEEANDFIINRLPNLAHNYHVDMPGVNIKPAMPFNNKVQLLPVDIQVSGEYRYLKEFIDRLEGYAKVIIVHDFNLNARRGTKDGRDMVEVGTQLNMQLAVLLDGE